jgi:homoserine dehydrogenase
LKLALVGFGKVGRALARLLDEQRSTFPFRIVGIHTARHGTALDPEGLPASPQLGPAARSVEDFLDHCQSEVLVEITPLNPATGEPAISHIRDAFARRMHVVTANKGPIAHAFASLRQEAESRGVQFRFESTVMDGGPVFSLVRCTLPGVRVLGFTGVLNSTTNVVIEAMRSGQSMPEGIDAARRMGITEADAGYDIHGWDSAAKTAAIANVLMDARVTPQQVNTRGIARLTPERLTELTEKRKTIRLVSRAKRVSAEVRLRVRAEVLEETDILAAVHDTSSLLLLHTDLMGTIGTLSVSPGIEQTAYGIFSDLVDLLSHHRRPRMSAK